jgi:hypothetical protein
VTGVTTATMVSVVAVSPEDVTGISPEPDEDSKAANPVPCNQQKVRKT